MGIDTLRRRPLDRLAELPWALWFGFHVLLYLDVWVATMCLGVLRLLSDVRWYWFRLAAILLFAAPFPLFVLSTYGLQKALPVAGAQLVTALLIVQPRENPEGWANRNPRHGRPSLMRIGPA